MSTIAMHLFTTLAQTTTGSGSGSGQQQPFFTTIGFPLMLVLGVFLVMSMFSKRKQDKKRQEALSSMKRGDRVQTIGGILGTIVEVRDTDIVVKVDESNNTKIKFTRSAVTKVIGDEEKTEAK